MELNTTEEDNLRILSASDEVIFSKQAAEPINVRTDISTTVVNMSDCISCTARWKRATYEQTFAFTTEYIV